MTNQHRAAGKPAPVSPCAPVSHLSLPPNGNLTPGAWPKAEVDSKGATNATETGVSQASLRFPPL